MDLEKIYLATPFQSDLKEILPRRRIILNNRISDLRVRSHETHQQVRVRMVLRIHEVGVNQIA